MNTLERKQTVLLVEDEAYLCRALAEVLRRSGYRVLKACDGEEALRILAGLRQPLQALVTDVNLLPEMSGPELAEELWALWPGTPVLFMSGGVPKSIAFARIRARPNTAFLQKPFFVNSLIRALELLMETDSKTDKNDATAAAV